MTDRSTSGDTPHVDGSALAPPKPPPRRQRREGEEHGQRAARESGVEGPLDFDRIYVEHVGWVWRALRGMGFRGAALEDAAQDVFVVVHRRLESFEARSSLKGWLYGILRNVAANHQRRYVRKDGHAPLPETVAAQAQDSPERRAESHEALDFVDSFLSSLSEDQRAVFFLIEVEELSAPEAAELLCVKLNTVYSRLRLARDAFQKALRQKEQP